VKHFHSHIRRDAAILYAREHPEVAFKTIAIAFGVSLEKARSTSALWSRYGKLGRPSGGNSPAYDFAKRTKAMQSFYESKRFDEKQLRDLLAEGLDFKEIGKRLDRNPAYLCDVARLRGYKYKPHYRGPSDKTILAYLAEHKKDDLVSLASALGYSGPHALKNRLKKMEVPIPPMPPPRIDHEAIRELLAKGVRQDLIAETFNCSQSTVSLVTKKYGLTQAKKITSSAEIIAYHHKHPKATLFEMAKAFGYTDPESLRRRFVKLGIRLSNAKRRKQ
jgi:hypothetical protein